MDRSTQVCLSVGIAALLVTATILILLPPTIDPGEQLIEWNPEWYFKAGDSFEYLITIKDTTHPLDPYNLIRYSEFNGTRIIVEILSLPALPELVNSSILIETLLQPEDINIQFANGTEILPNFVAFLDRAFSLSFIPIGIWDVVQMFLPREPSRPDDYYYTRYFAKTNESYNIGCYSWAIDAGGEWGGNVTHTTGIPFMVYRYWDSISDPDPQMYFIAHLV